MVVFHAVFLVLPRVLNSSQSVCRRPAGLTLGSSLKSSTGLALANYVLHFEYGILARSLARSVIDLEVLRFVNQKGLAVSNSDIVSMKKTATRYSMF